MAASQPEKGIDITTCPICIKEFKIPKCLPCSHSFCELCLSSYIITAIKSESTNIDGISKFRCPVCREKVTPPDTSVKYQDWAKQFPVNHFLISLMDQNKLKAKIKLCDPCKSIDDVTAVSWCLNCDEALCHVCTSVHERQKMTRDHELKNIDEMQTIPLVTSLQTCENHKGKLVEAFCSDHNQPCCATCVVIHHRKCNHVTTLEEAAREITQSKDLSDLLQRLKNIDALNKTIITEKQDSMKTLEDQKKGIEKELQNTRQRLICNFDKHYSTFMQAFSQKHTHKIKELTDSIQDIENRTKVIQNCTNLIEVCMTRCSETHVFLEMKKVLEREEEQVKALNRIQSKHKIVKYAFKMDTNLNKLVNDFKTVGEVDILEFSNTCTKYYPKSFGDAYLKECVPELVSAFSVEDKCGIQSYVYGMCFMSDNTLLLPLYDCGNKLAVFDADGDFLKLAGISSGIFGISQLDFNTAVSTHSFYNKKLSFINSQKLVVYKTIPLGEICFGIACDDNSIYIGCKDKLLILDNHGNKEGDIITIGNIYGVTIIKQGEKKIVFTNYSCNSCHFFRSRDLQEVNSFTHQELKGPHGVTSDREDNVYITGTNSNNVFQVSSEAILIRILLTGLPSPIGILFDDNCNRLYVSCSCPAKLNIYNMKNNKQVDKVKRLSEVIV